MKKKAVLLWVTGCLLCGVAMTGCGPMGQLRNVARMSGAESGIEEKAGSKEEKEEEKKKAADSKTPVLGGEAVESFEDFSYLYEETLTAYMEEDTEIGKVKRKTVTVYIPEGNASGINAELPGTAYADTFGVTFRFSLNPYLISGQEEKTVTEKLQGYMDETYPDKNETKKKSHKADYEGLELSEVEKIGQDAAVARAEYFVWNDEKEEYGIVYGTYYLKELEPDLLALLEVEVDSSKAASKTEELLKELEAFYEVDLEWNSDEAQEKLEDYLAGKEEEEVPGAIGGIIEFDYPKGWALDENYSDEGLLIYAPGGDSDGAGCGIAITSLDSFGVTDDVMGWLGDEEYFSKFIEEGLGEDAENLTARYYGNTCIGETTLAEFTYTEEGEVIDCRLYIGGDDEKIYIIVAVQFQWLEMNTFEVAEELLEKGKVR